jgi:hypothetical protein
MVSTAGYTVAAEQRHSISFVATIWDFFPEDDDDDEVPGDSRQDMEKLRNLVPPEYHDHLLLFTKKEADKLHLHRYIDEPLYSMSASELKDYSGIVEGAPLQRVYTGLRIVGRMADSLCQEKRRQFEVMR